jgi:hypothetical protein
MTRDEATAQPDRDELNAINTPPPLKGARSLAFGTAVAGAVLLGAAVLWRAIGRTLIRHSGAAKALRMAEAGSLGYFAYRTLRQRGLVRQRHGQHLAGVSLR